MILGEGGSLEHPPYSAHSCLAVNAPKGRQSTFVGFRAAKWDFKIGFLPNLVLPGRKPQAGVSSSSQSLPAECVRFPDRQAEPGVAHP